MGVTFVQARVFGESGTTGSTTSWLTQVQRFSLLPQEEIDALGLSQGTRDVFRLMSATGPVEVPKHTMLNGELKGQEFAAILVPAATPLLGYELLQNLRFKVNPVTREIEKVSDDEWHPPFL